MTQIFSRIIIVSAVAAVVASLSLTTGARAQETPKPTDKTAITAQQKQEIATFKKEHALFLKYYAARQYEKAETAVKTALRLARKLLGHKHLITATEANNLAVLYISTRRYKQAVPLLQEALATRRALLKKGDRRIGDSLSDLQTVFLALGRPREEYKILQQMLSFYEAQQPQNSERLAFALDRLGVLEINAGKLEQAEGRINRAIEIYGRLYGRRHKDTALALSNLAVIRTKQKDYKPALALFDEVYQIRKSVLGPDHPLTLQTMTEIADIASKLKQYDRAISLLKEIIKRNEKRLGADHIKLAGEHNRLAAYAFRAKDFDLAGRELVRAIDITTKNEGEDSPHLLVYLLNVATLYENLGQYQKALPMYRRRLVILEKKYGKTAPEVVDALIQLGRLARQVTLFEASENYLKTAIAREQERHPPRKKKLRDAWSNLAGLYRETARYDDSARAYKTALAAHLAAKDAKADNLARLYDNLGVLNIDIQRYDLAEQFHKKALALFEETLGPDDRAVAFTLNNLATVYQYQGRYEEAVTLQERAISIYRKTAQRADTRVGVFYDNLAGSYRHLGRTQEAADYYKKAMEALLLAYGPDHPEVALAMSNLAAVYGERKDYAEAERLLQKALAIDEKVYGPNHPQVGNLWRLLGENDFDRKDYGAAGQHLQKALGIFEKANGPDHPKTGLVALKLARLYLWQQKYPLALAHYRRAARIEELRQKREQAGTVRETDEGNRGIFSGLAITTWHIAATPALLKQTGENRDKLMDEGLQGAQKALRTSAGAALAQMSARFAAGSGRLAEKVRQRQDLTRRYGKLDKKLLALVGAPPGKRDSKAIARLRTRLKKTAEQLDSLDRQLAADFPEYASLANPKPLTGKEIQKQLQADEALISFMMSNEAVYIWALTNEDFSWHRIPLKRKLLREKVALLRRGLDPQNVPTRGFAQTTPEQDKNAVQTSFDLAVSHALYKSLLQPLEGTVGSKKHLLIVASDALTGLPFQVLVTAPPPETGDDESALYRKAAWLIKRHALTTLPSISSLRALRQFAGKGKRAPKALIAFGDPVFSKAEKPRQLAANTAEFTSFYRGGQVNLAALSQLAQLPDTKDELIHVASTLNVPLDEVRLGRKATETAVKELDAKGELAKYRIVYFATHGLISGDIKGLGEPALALSLPAKATEIDDGLLTASEVTQLHLNADWVVLSACNTASGEKPGAEALSGLARAFFYSGAKSLLVSHWPVFSDAATLLTTKAFKIIEAGQTLARPVGRAEALRRAMLAVMNKPGDALAAHPSYWAPFVVVGEGAVVAK